VHASDLRVGELRVLQAKQVMPVFCPGTHRYFARARPAFADAGLAAPLLGCDSRASNARLDPFLELVQAREILPEYSAQAWWSALTTRAAASLGLASRKGSLLAGREGLFLRLPDPLLRDPAALCDSLASPHGPRPLARPGCPPPLDVCSS
jgi:cytosine/adenosine deaminase-related metal-dependent hydrolase